MAQTLCIQGADGRFMHALRRSPAAPALLPLITFGVYYLYWYYAINRELCELGKMRGIRGLGSSPMLSFMAVAFGWALILPPFISHVQTTRRIKRAQRGMGLAPMSGFLAFILAVFFLPARAAYIQSELNGLWAVAAGMPGFAPQPQQAMAWAAPPVAALPAAPPPVGMPAEPAPVPALMAAPPAPEAIAAPAHAMAPPPSPSTRIGL